jgi:hypothetical protein
VIEFMHQISLFRMIVMSKSASVSWAVLHESLITSLFVWQVAGYI